MSNINFQKPLNVCRASAGTGKTFTLAAYYVGLLLSGVDYRSILAVTFTNNATSEMKERIMAYLYQLKEGQEHKFLDLAKTFMTNNTNDSDKELRQRAGECFRSMLLDYDNVHVQTIDSFLLNLQSGLAAVLKMSAGYTPELDTLRVITQAVDQMLSTDMTETAKDLLIKYVTDNLEEENRKNIRKTLIEMAKELYDESVQMLDADHRILFDTQDIDAYCARLDAEWENNEDVKALRALIARTYKVDESLSNGGALNKAIENIDNSLNNLKAIDKDKYFRGLTDKQLPKAEGGDWTKLPADLVKIVVQATYTARRCLRTYNTIQLSKQFAHDLQLMSELRAIIQRNLIESNRTLLAQTASMLHKALKEGDADFILEKVGIRYHHVLLDEFQDTSKLQWTIFDRLIKELVAGGENSILVVGDIKQSIYRWRNGDWHTMYELGRKGENGQKDDYYVPYLNEEFPRLSCNYRSSKEVVNFNLSLFKHICNQYSDFAYTAGENPNTDDASQVRNIYNEDFSPEKIAEYYNSKPDAGKSGGYVCFRAFPKEKSNANINAQLAQNMFDEIEKLLQDKDKDKDACITPDQIMILVRTNKDTDLIIDEYKKLDKENYKKLSQVTFATENSYKLVASQDVRAIIAILKYLTAGNNQKDSIYEEQIRKLLPECDLNQLKEQIRLDAPLFETICDIIRLYLCDSNGKYLHNEHAYLDTFLDNTRGYVASEGGNVEDFLTYWDDILFEKSIPMTSVGAIRIMTVHKSKGLEAQTLFVPFCNWDAEESKNPKVWCNTTLLNEENQPYSMPIKYGKDMIQSDYQADYERERHNSRIDNLNLLYVALTRARDNLFVFTDCTKDMKPSNSVGEYLLRYLQISSDEFDENGYAERIFGQLTISKDKSNDNNPFDFKRAKKEESQLWSDGRQVRFIQSQEGQLYTSHGEEAARLVERMEEGTLCHDIFAHIHTLDQLDGVLDDFESRGEIANPEQRETLKSLISSAWEGNEKVRGWFTDPWKLQLESSIFENRKEIRPDRVMIDDAQKKAIVLDYKFGCFKPSNHKKYTEQVHKYMQAMRNLGYTDVEGYLWYAQNPQNEQLKQV